MSLLHDIWESIYSVIRTMRAWDLLDIALLSYIIYYFYKLVRETRAGQLFKGIAFLLIVYAFGKLVELKAITYLLERLFSFGILALLIVFQPEVRRAVEKLGHSQFTLNSLRLVSGGNEEIHWTSALNDICRACESLSKTKTGALIVIERRTRLGEYIRNGTIINADVSTMLLGNLFFKNSPLHDGAVIIRDGRVHAGGCQLPTPQKEEEIDKLLGSRHRAAIGMSENSDAIIIVVSEETGVISVAENGTLTRDFTTARLYDYLSSRIIPKSSEKKRFFGIRRKPKPADDEAGVDETTAEPQNDTEEMGGSHEK